MENASKALIMAGEILISIIIVSALLLMFNNLTSYQKVNEQNTEEAQVIAFNSTYEAYNTNDVRGNDLYSLINRVVDYNKRKSTEGIGEKDEGQYLKYQPMTIKVSFEGKQTELTAPDGEQRIFKKSKLENGKEFTINATNNKFDTLFDEINDIKKNYETRVLDNLTTAMTKIFVGNEVFNGLSQSDKKQIIYNFNNAIYGSKIELLDDTEISESWKTIQLYQETIYTYYEYLQFTRAHFNCTGVEYNEGTGRIVSMEFQFNGKIN